MLSSFDKKSPVRRRTGRWILPAQLDTKARAILGLKRRNIRIEVADKPCNIIGLDFQALVYLVESLFLSSQHNSIMAGSLLYLLCH